MASKLNNNRHIKMSLQMIIIHLIFTSFKLLSVGGYNNSTADDNLDSLTNFSIINNITWINKTTNDTNLTEIVTNSTVEATATTPTSTPFDTTFKDAYTTYFHSNDEFCTCNLTTNWCDINCCCDTDCNHDELSSFGECIKTAVKKYNPRYCRTSNIVYLNNTQTTIEKLSNGLFCIVWDNVADFQVFEDRKPLNTINEIEKIKPIHNFKWLSTTHDFNNNDLLKYDIFRRDFKLISGSKMAITKYSDNNTRKFEIWKLQTNMMDKNGECNAWIPVRYLHNFKSNCYRLIRNSSEECLKMEYFNANFYYSFIYVSRNFLNISDINLMFVNITTDKEYSEPYLDNTSNYCRNVVKSVEYLVIHNGSYGVIDAQIKLKLSDFKLNAKWFEQQFSVSFVWFNKSDNDVLFLSGNPGYITGKPVLFAYMGYDKSNVSFVSNGYQIISYSNNGFCDLNQTIFESIKFGINKRSGCLLKLKTVDTNTNNTCEWIQNTIWKILRPNAYIDRIGMFGNSNVSVMHSWSAILDHNNTHTQSPETDNSLVFGVCANLVTAVSLRIYFAHIGPINEPQPKIIGSVRTYETLKRVDVNCINNSLVSCDQLFIELSSSVSFHDITNRWRTQYSPSPPFKFQLPNDFFYPFLTNCASNSCPYYLLHFIIITIIYAIIITLL